jgi:hypothetical protein
MPHHRLVVKCHVLTFVLDDFVYRMGELPDKVLYPGVDWNEVKEIRIIVTGELNQRLSEIGQRKYTPATTYRYRTSRRGRMLAALISGSKVPLTIYVFDFDEPGDEEIISMRRRIERLLVRSYRAQERSGSTYTHAEYTIKTLSDYMAEGLEDELLWQELLFWRMLDRDLKELDDKQKDQARTWRRKKMRKGTSRKAAQDQRNEESE